jgi:hypothetical protein
VVALRDMDRARKVSQLKKTVQRARQAFNSGHYAESAAAFTESITLNPSNPIYLVLRSLAYMADNDPRADEDVGRIAHVDSLYPMTSPILQGTLQKRGTGPVAGWKARYFVFKERFLWYYKGQKEIFPVDVILLHRYKCVKHAKSPVRFSLEFDGGRRIHHLKCNSKEERDNWVDMLQTVAAQPITLPMDARENLVYFHDDEDGAAPVDGKLLLVGLTHSGFLWKAGRINTAPKLRWFVLKDHVLYYFRKQETTREAQYYGSIKLHGAQLNVTTPLEFSLILPNRIWSLRADVAEEAMRWIQVLSAETVGEVAKLAAPDANDEKVAKLKSNFRATLAAKDFAVLKKGVKAGVSVAGGMESPVLDASAEEGLLGEDYDEDTAALARGSDGGSNSNLPSTNVAVVVAAPKIAVLDTSGGGFGDMVNGRTTAREGSSSPPWKQTSAAAAGSVPAGGLSANSSTYATPASSYGSSVTSEQRYFARLGLSVPDSDQSEDELVHGLRSAARSATATDDESNQSSYSDYTESAKLLSSHQAKKKAEKDKKKIDVQKKKKAKDQQQSDDGEDDGGCCGCCG